MPYCASLTCMRFEILTVAAVNITLAYHVIPCSLVVFPPERRYASNRLHGVTLQNIIISVAPILFKTMSETRRKGMKFEIVMAVTIKITVLWDVTT
jgi:hypothetical protein